MVSTVKHVKFALPHSAKLNAISPSNLNAASDIHDHQILLSDRALTGHSYRMQRENRSQKSPVSILKNNRASSLKSVAKSTTTLSSNGIAKDVGISFNGHTHLNKHNKDAMTAGNHLFTIPLAPLLKGVYSYVSDVVSDSVSNIVYHLYVKHYFTN